MAEALGTGAEGLLVKRAKTVEKIPLPDFHQARNNALKWLEARGFKAEIPTIGKFGENAGKAIGMKTSDGTIGFRIEFDERNGAHINVWAGKEKGPHFNFDANSETVNNIVKRFWG